MVIGIVIKAQDVISMLRGNIHRYASVLVLGWQVRGILARAFLYAFSDLVNNFHLSLFHSSLKSTQVQ